MPTKVELPKGLLEKFSKTRMKIKISPDGKLVEGLYDDKFPWYGLRGKLEIERASDVFFDPKEQGWKVKILCNQRILPKCFRLRKDAIEYEREYLETDDFAQTKKRFDERIRNIDSAISNLEEN